MTPDFVRAPEDRVRLWNAFKRGIAIGGGAVLLFLLLLAVATL